MTAADGAPLPQDARSPSGDGVALPPAPAVDTAPVVEPVITSPGASDHPMTVEPPPRRRRRRPQPVPPPISPLADVESRLQQASVAFGSLRKRLGAQWLPNFVEELRLHAGGSVPVLADAAAAVLEALRELQPTRRTRRSR